MDHENLVLNATFQGSFTLVQKSFSMHTFIIESFFHSSTTSSYLISLHDPHCRKLFLNNKKLRTHLTHLGLVGCHFSLQRCKVLMCTSDGIWQKMKAGNYFLYIYCTGSTEYFVEVFSATMPNLICLSRDVCLNPPNLPPHSLDL